MTGHVRATQSGPMEQTPLQPGQIIARGVMRYLRSLDYIGLLEFSPKRGRRVDVAALGPKGEIWVIECKSSRADFKQTINGKNIWNGATAFISPCHPIFQSNDQGLIYADGYGPKSYAKQMTIPSPPPDVKTDIKNRPRRITAPDLAVRGHGAV